jgi:hypothetical protein
MNTSYPDPRNGPTTQQNEVNRQLLQEVQRLRAEQASANRSAESIGRLIFWFVAAPIIIYTVVNFAASLV